MDQRIYQSISHPLETFRWFLTAYRIKPRLLAVVFKNPANLSSLTSYHSPMSWALLASGSLSILFPLFRHFLLPCHLEELQFTLEATLKSLL